MHITETSVKIHEDTIQHSNYQSEIIHENDSLRKEIQALKQFQSKKEQEHLQTLEDTHLQYKHKIDTQTNEYNQKTTALKEEHHSKLHNVNSECQ